MQMPKISNFQIFLKTHDEDVLCPVRMDSYRILFFLENWIKPHTLDNQKPVSDKQVRLFEKKL